GDRLRLLAGEAFTNPKLGLANTYQRHAIHTQRRDRKRKAFLPFRRLRLPQIFAVLGVVGDDMSVERGAEDLAVVNRCALVGDTAADDARGLRRPIERLLPDLLAGGNVDRDGRLGVGDVHHAVVDDRLRLL